jgi:hypothetical protein
MMSDPVLRVLGVLLGFGSFLLVLFGALVILGGGQ